MKEFDKIYFKHMLEKKTSKANKIEVGKRVKQELMTYIDNRKDEMTPKDYSKVEKMATDISNELDPEKIFDDLMKVGEIVGLKDSYSRMVAKVIQIANELENHETLKADVLGEPEPEGGKEEPAPDEEDEEPPKKKGEEEDEDEFDLGL